MTNLANQFVKSENEVVFVTNFPSEHEYFLENDITRCSLEAEESKENTIKKNWNRICGLRKKIKKYKPDIVISFMHENDVRAYLAVRGLKTKLMLSVRNDPKVLYQSSMRARIAKYVYGHADAVVFQTEEAKRWFGDIKGKSAIIYNQVAPEFYETNRTVLESKNVVTTGKFMSQKNHKMLIEAFHMIADDIEDDLIIYGEGKLRDEYEAYIKVCQLEHRVFLPGNCTNVAETIAQSKLFVMSSDYEGMPNSLMEAMALGLPCISTNCPCGGPKELSGEWNAIELIEVGNTEELANKMKNMLMNVSYREEKARLAQNAAERFRPDLIYKQWETYILDVLRM